MTHRLRAAIAIAGPCLARTAWACPVCYDAGSPGGLRSYYASTVMLSALPFVIVGTIAAIGYVLARRVHSLDDTHPAITTR